MIHQAKYLFLIALFSFIYSTSSVSQNDTIFKALSDELKRNMEELGNGDDYSPPFYIEYALNEYSIRIISASLGSVVFNNSITGRKPWARVLMGNYNLTDENFSDRTSRINHNDGGMPIPIENDYNLLRRAYWLITNNTFKNASELYRKKVAAMELKELTVEDLPAPDFSKESPTTFFKTAEKNDYNALKVMDMAKDLSREFINYPEIFNSEVYVIHVSSTDNKVTSEGSQLSSPFAMYVIIMNAGIYNDDNNVLWQRIYYHSKTLDGFPEMDVIKKDIDKLANNLKFTAKAEKYTEKYIGPVMLESQAVVELGFMRLFLMGNESLLASRAPLINDKNNGLIISNVQTWENRIDKRVIDNKISIYDISTTPNYNGKSLLGCFDMDLDGVKPSDSLLLIEDGILKSQLTERTPTSKQHNSTGHSRLVTDLKQMTGILSPGVVLIESNETLPKQDIKSKLMEKGRDEGLDYVILARNMESSANINPVNYYKVDTETGEETLLRGVRYALKIDDLRDIEYVSNTNLVLNTMFINRNPDFVRGAPTSFISPDAIVIKETQISGDANTIKGELPIVPSPMQVAESH